MKYMKRIVKILLVLLCLAVLVGASAQLVQRKKASLAKVPRYGEEPTPVHVAESHRGSLEITRDYLAIIEPAQTANLASRLTSSVISVTVDEGDLVKANDPLIFLDDREIVAAIAATEAKVAQAEAEVAANEAMVSALEKSAEYWVREAERRRRLLASGAAAASETEATVDKANQLTKEFIAAKQKSEALRQQVAALKGEVQELMTRKGYCTITSPFAGVVTHRYVDPGDEAAPGKTLLVIEDRSFLKLQFDIPQQDIPCVSVGMAVHFAGPSGPRTATITNIFPSLNKARMLRAEVVLKDALAEGLHTGAYLPITVVLATLKDVTLVPTSAIVESPTGQAHVFVVTKGKLQPVEVTVLGRSDHETAVDGIPPMTEVVVSTFLGWSQLSAGLSVEAIR
ncbi:MAG: efflux RND transporter periplasmic adaptor subunit [Thermogutta sp.]